MRSFWYSLTPEQRFKLRKLYYLPKDLYSHAGKGKFRYAPPRGAIFTGGAGDPQTFLEQGRGQMQILLDHADLKKNDSVLDMGSGLGRTASALAEFLDAESRYEGFDIVEEGVEWCKSRIGEDHTNFGFTHIPLKNDLYSAVGSSAAEVNFPYAEQTFDLAFSFSVFTHMPPDEVRRYLTEAYRVTKPEGRLMSTFFLYDDSNEDFISTDNGFRFPVAGDGCRYMHERTKSGNLAYHLETLEKMAADTGWKLAEVRHGFWKKHIEQEHDFYEYQDVVRMEKKV